MANDKGNAQAEKPKKRSRVKETFSELKKVTWPTFGKTMKQTGAVLLVTVFFLAVLLVMDQLLGLAHRQFIKSLPSTETDVESVVAALGGMLRSAKAAVCSLFAGTPALPLI